MRSAAIRHVLHLELTLMNHYPVIVREVAIDQDLTLADLAGVIRAVFGGPHCAHHLFASSPDHLRWSHRRTRWGDRSTLIDLRDPTLVDEATARIRSVLRSGEPITFAHTCDSSWAVRITAGLEDVVPATGPAVCVVRGERAAPLECTRTPFEHEVLLDVLGDPEHPRSGALRASLAAAVGPWATYDPAWFDLTEAQRAVDAAVGAATGELQAPSVSGLLKALVESLPRAARPGLRSHIASAGLELPAVVTVDEAAHLTRELCWALTRADGTGIPLVDGSPDPKTLQEGSDALGVGTDRIRGLFAAARALRFVYARKGRLITKKAVAAALVEPVALWNMLADAVLHAPLGHSPTARVLILLTIADGSAPDPAIGMSRAADVFAMIDSSRSRAWTDFDSDRWDTCDHRCDCPRTTGDRWHDIVDASIDDAARAATSDGSVTLARWSVDGRGLDEPLGWRGRGPGGAFAVDHGEHYDPAIGTRVPALLRAASDLITLLSVFGLARDSGGAWVVPPTLQQLARRALQTGSPWSVLHATTAPG